MDPQAVAALQGQVEELTRQLQALQLASRAPTPVASTKASDQGTLLEPKAITEEVKALVDMVRSPSSGDGGGDEGSTTHPSKVQPRAPPQSQLKGKDFPLFLKRYQRWLV